MREACFPPYASRDERKCQWQEDVNNNVGKTSSQKGTGNYLFVVSLFVLAQRQTL